MKIRERAVIQWCGYKTNFAQHQHHGPRTIPQSVRLGRRREKRIHFSCVVGNAYHNQPEGSSGVPSLWTRGRMHPHSLKNSWMALKRSRWPLRSPERVVPMSRSRYVYPSNFYTKNTRDALWKLVPWMSQVRVTSFSCLNWKGNPRKRQR